ncbi:RNA polymerase sigma factor [Paenibacillus hamazuiensis]|uniref:RNA polymerase sigma factor n=1 Tax=Paenibacillus hamazuiensis TaxID=2936508 RepID=UPI00200C8A8E|nr:RNA polymerase sigma factor [Paenibacillus hamazuiensis]
MFRPEPHHLTQSIDWMESIRPELRAYCLSLARDVWEADDLVQDTLLRLLRVADREPDKRLSKSYAFRIARNLWIDHVRKRGRDAFPLPDESFHETMSDRDNAFDTRETLDAIARLLAPRSVVVLLLMDIFDFTAKETASMIDSTDGAVQVALSRARSKLRAVAGTVKADADGPPKRNFGSAPDPVWFEAILDGFRRRNPRIIYEAYLRLSGGGIRIRQLRSVGGRLFFTFQDPDGNLIMVST